MNKKAVLNCEFCSKEFHRFASQAKYQHHYCSQECKSKAQKKVRYRNCEFCGKGFLLKRKEGRFCSILCRNRNTIDKRDGLIRDNDNFLIYGGIKRKSKKVICGDCGKELWVVKCRDHGGYCDLCSSKRNLLLSDSGAMERNSNWKGGSHHTYRRMSFLQHGEKCLACDGSKEAKRIEAHHIDCDRDNNSLNNLVPLCSICHKEVHRKIKLGSNCYEALDSVARLSI